MNAPAAVPSHAVWTDTALVFSMADNADDNTPMTATVSAEQESDEWVSQMLVECYN